MADIVSARTKWAAALAEIDAYAAPSPAPTITNARATPSSLPAGGGSVVIDATVANATQVTLDGPVVTLPKTVNVTASRTFVLAAHGATPPDAQISIPVTVAQVVQPLPVVTTIMPNMAKLVVVQGWMGGVDRYERAQHVAIGRVVHILTLNMNSGGTSVPFGSAKTLTLLLDGNPVASVTVAAVDVAAAFTVPNTVVDGYYIAAVTGLDSSWSMLPYGVYILTAGALVKPHALMPVVTASHELSFESVGLYQYAMVPTKFDPVVVPYPARTFPDAPAVPARKDLVITSLAVPRPGDLYRPALTKEGIWTTANRENYFYYDFERPLISVPPALPGPVLPMLDGPRGRGSIIAPVHLEVGNAAPNGVLRGNVYFIESWRIGKVTPDGTVITLAGHRHKSIADYWQDPSTAELVGDWSSIPLQRRGFAQPWGMAWDPRTLVINEAAAPIPSENNEKPHVSDIVLYVSDTYNNRVVRLTYSMVAHGIPPKVDEFVTGLNRPWDCIAVGSQLYVSDRFNNAIKVYDMDTAALIKTISVVQPEGMALLDGFLYYASVKSKSIRKINLATNVDTLISDVNTPNSNMGYYINDNARYMKIAVSDGTFGPRGMVAYSTWSNSYYGYPVFIDGNNGRMIDWLANYAGAKGTNPLGLTSYATAVGIGHGRMLFGTAEEGLHVASAPMASDVVIDGAKYNAGRDEYEAQGLNKTHGPGGFGYYGLPQPWGKSANIDYFLTISGHVKAA